MVYNAEVISRVSDIEEPHCQSLLERVALRYLEESVVSNQIDAEAIPLLKALIGLEGGGRALKVTSVKDRFNKELILRVQTEVKNCLYYDMRINIYEILPLSSSIPVIQDDHLLSAIRLVHSCTLSLALSYKL